MKTRVKWAHDMMFVGETASGHAVVMDAAPDIGGRNLGPRPMELLLVGLGGCSAIDVVLILKRGREAITDCDVEIEAERADTDPKVFTRIKLHFIVTGNNLDPQKVERAVKLSHDKYCSASAMLAATATMTYDFEIREAGAVTTAVTPPVTT
jgi:putative redox protein